MSYTARVVANAFLWKNQGKAEPLTHMKLQKLVYFMHAWYLAMYDKALVSNERPQAWQYGPVFPSIYHELKSYGSAPVKEMLTELSPHTGKFVTLIPNREDKDFWPMYEKVWAQYGKFNAIQLSSLTHVPGSPWAQTPSGAPIPDDAIKTYYRRKLDSGVGSH
jgi:uncharacterized phage-associated protein